MIRSAQSHRACGEHGTREARTERPCLRQTTDPPGGYFPTGIPGALHYVSSMNRTFVTPILFAFLLASGASAQKPPATGEALQVHPQAKAAIDRIKSPYCPGMMLEVCTSSGGAMLRDTIQRMAEAGLSSDSIVEIIVGEYGEEWRAEPLRSGTGLWAWVIPPGVLAGGLALVGIVLARRRRLARETTSGAAAPAAVAPDDEERLKAALKELDEEEEPVF